MGCIYSSAKNTYRDTYWAVGHQYRAPTYPIIFRAWDPLFLQKESRFIAIVFKACVDIAFLYSYVEYSQFRASVEVIFWLPLLPVCRGPSWLSDYVTVVSDSGPSVANKMTFPFVR